MQHRLPLRTHAVSEAYTGPDLIIVIGNVLGRFDQVAAISPDRTDADVNLLSWSR